MIQFYCLSVIMNMLIGLISIFGGDTDDPNAFANDSLDDDIFGDVSDNADNNSIFAPNSFVNDSVFRLVLGALSIFVGIIKLFPLSTGGVPVLADFFPAFAGIFGGACFVIEYLNETVSLPSFVEIIFIDSKRYIGFFCAGVSLLHFLIPQIVLV